MAAADALVPVMAAAAGSVAAVHAALRDTGGFLTVWSDNARLRAENDQLRRWQAAALALEAENAALKANLRWVPDPAPSFVTARVVADAGGVYARSVLVSAGLVHGLQKGQVALDEGGLVGRVAELGKRSARVLLLTDISSRVPVMLGESGARAILAGTNGSRPRLLHWPEGTAPVEGEHVVTSAEADAFPAGLPVGVVRYGAGNIPEVDTAARLDRLTVVRIFDYGLRGMSGAEAGVRPAERRGK